MSTSLRQCMFTGWQGSNASIITGESIEYREDDAGGNRVYSLSTISDRYDSERLTVAQQDISPSRGQANE